jgi:hypothetical protein
MGGRIDADLREVNQEEDTARYTISWSIRMDLSGSGFFAQSCQQRTAVSGTAAPWRTMTGILLVASKERLASKINGVDIVQ